MAAVMKPCAAPAWDANGIRNGASNGVVAGNLPVEWYTEPAMYELERRALFSKHWVMVTHRVRFPQPGNYLKFKNAGYDYFLIKSRKGDIQAFHNVCRHRAYPILDDSAPQEGKRTILSCNYHGWSFGLDGKLAKAPKFDEVEGFNRDDYNLFKIHTHIDKVGFIWVNFDASDSPIPWEEFNGGSDERPSLTAFNLDQYVHDRSWTVKGKYNWKLAIENYNECYHCQASHPDIAKITNLDKYAVDPIKGRLEHEAPNKDNIKADDFEFFGDSAFAFHFPATAANATTPLFYILRFDPVGPITADVEYQFFRNVNASDEDYERAYEFYDRVEREDIPLSTGVQRNLNNGIYTHGPLHAKREAGVLLFDQLVQNAMKAHMELEEAAGREIWPAKRMQKQHEVTEAQKSFADNVCACGKTNGCQ